MNSTFLIPTRRSDHNPSNFCFLVPRPCFAVSAALPPSPLAPAAFLSALSALSEDASATCSEPGLLLQIKQKENDVALRHYLRVVASLEQLRWEERQLALVRGLLAGNVFDWGAKAVSE